MAPHDAGPARHDDVARRDGDIPAADRPKVSAVPRHGADAMAKNATCVKMMKLYPDNFHGSDSN